MRVMAVVCIAGLFLAGCGYKGALYLPGQEPSKKGAQKPAPQASAPAPASGGASR
jgi:predicted small lipoprotein YifL